MLAVIATTRVKYSRSDEVLFLNIRELNYTNSALDSYKWETVSIILEWRTDFVIVLAEAPVI